MARNWDDEPDLSSLQAWVYSGLRAIEWDGKTEWIGDWTPVVIKDTTGRKCLVQRADRQCAWVERDDIWRGAQRIDTHCTRTPEWVVETVEA